MRLNVFYLYIFVCANIRFLYLILSEHSTWKAFQNIIIARAVCQHVSPLIPSKPKGQSASQLLLATAVAYSRYFGRSRRVCQRYLPISSPPFRRVNRCRDPSLNATRQVRITFTDGFRAELVTRSRRVTSVDGGNS